MNVLQARLTLAIQMLFVQTLLGHTHAHVTVDSMVMELHAQIWMNVVSEHTTVT